MPRSAIEFPQTDPTPIFEIVRSHHAVELFAAAVAHFDLFGQLAAAPLTFDALRQRLGLAERPATVLIVALRAMQLLTQDAAGRLTLSPAAREHLVAGEPFYAGDYVGLAAQTPGVLAMVERLRANRPANAEPDQSGAAYIYREGMESAMESEATARHFTLALAGRAKNVAPHLAAQLDFLSEAQLLVDVGGGTGIYSIACLQRYPRLQAIVWDRPEVLKVAAEMAAEYGVADRLICQPGDMFADPVPKGADAILLSNILHDWDVPACAELVARTAAPLGRGKRLLIHDAFLNDALDGPLPIALYSAALFFLTEGRAYSAAEYRSWLVAAGLEPQPVRPTLVHCGVLPAVRP